MGIDVYTYARKNATLVDAQDSGVNWIELGFGHLLSKEDGGTAEFAYKDIGYLRESYHGAPYPTKLFIPESYDREHYEEFGEHDEYGERMSGVHIPLDVLESRLEATLEMSADRARRVYDITKPEEIEMLGQPYKDFIAVHRALAAAEMPAYIFNSY